MHCTTYEQCELPSHGVRIIFCPRLLRHKVFSSAVNEFIRRFARRANCLILKARRECPPRAFDRIRSAAVTAPRLAIVLRPTPIIGTVGRLEIGRRSRRIGQITARKTGVTTGIDVFRHLPAVCILESHRGQSSATREGIIPYACHAVGDGD